MRSFWSDPYLWIHLAGIAALPVWLELCFLGLAVGDPVLPVWLELLFISVVGIVPILRMQWQRPFYIFSLVAVTVKPEQLSEDQRRLLTLFKALRNRILAVVVAALLFIVLRQLYNAAPIAASAVPFSFSSRWLGLLVAAIAFLSSNLFLQVPVSVLSVMLTSESAFAATTPYATEQIRQEFTLLGLQIKQILPPVTPSVTAKPVAVASNISDTVQSDTVGVQSDALGSDVLGSTGSDSSELESAPLNEPTIYTPHVESSSEPEAASISNITEVSDITEAEDAEAGNSTTSPSSEEPMDDPPT